jgi:rod shape-determining protein MreB
MQLIYGVDMGTSNIKLYNGSTKEILNEKNVIAIKNKKEVLAAGDEAFEMFQKAPDNIQVSFPVREGVIADLKNMESLFERFFVKCNKLRTVRSGRFIIAVPTDITEVEKRAFYDVIDESNVKVKEIRVVEKPIADAIGVGIDMNSSRGNMIVNIGADTTEISVISGGGIVISRIVKTGGNKLDESIVNIVKKKYNIHIGLKTAEQIKFALADAMYDEDSDVEDVCNVFGRNVITGLPSERPVSSDLIYEAIKEFIVSIVEAIKTLLERTPPELTADIKESGIFLTGGSTCIKNIEQLIANETGLRINTVRTPGESVIRGIAKIISDPQYKKIPYTPREKTL